MSRRRNRVFYSIRFPAKKILRNFDSGHHVCTNSISPTITPIYQPSDYHHKGLAHIFVIFASLWILPPFWHMHVSPSPPIVNANNDWTAHWLHGALCAWSLWFLSLISFLYVLHIFYIILLTSFPLPIITTPFSDNIWSRQNKFPQISNGILYLRPADQIRPLTRKASADCGCLAPSTSWIGTPGSSVWWVGRGNRMVTCLMLCIRFRSSIKLFGILRDRKQDVCGA